MSPLTVLRPPPTCAASIVILPLTFDSSPRMSAPFASCAEPLTAETSPLTCAPSASRSVPFTVSMLAAFAARAQRHAAVDALDALDRRIALDIDRAVDRLDVRGRGAFFDRDRAVDGRHVAGGLAGLDAHRAVDLGDAAFAGGRPRAAGRPAVPDTGCSSKVLRFPDDSWSAHVGWTRPACQGLQMLVYGSAHGLIPRMSPALPRLFKRRRAGLPARGVGATLNVLASRIGRIIDRARIMEDGCSATAGDRARAARAPARAVAPRDAHQSRDCVVRAVRRCSSRWWSLRCSSAPCCASISPRRSQSCS